MSNFKQKRRQLPRIKRIRSSAAQNFIVFLVHDFSFALSHGIKRNLGRKNEILYTMTTPPPGAGVLLNAPRKWRRIFHPENKSNQFSGCEVCINLHTFFSKFYKISVVLTKIFPGFLKISLKIEILLKFLLFFSFCKFLPLLKMFKFQKIC